MKFSNFQPKLLFIQVFVLVVLALSSSGCGLIPSNLFPDLNQSATPGVSSHFMSGDNVLPMTVNGSLCAAGSYPNKPCVAITICPASMPAGSTPDSTCQTITDVLVDTGSSGLRVFKSALNQNLLNSFTQVTSDDGSSKPIAECAAFGDGSQDWGPVQMASVVLGNEPSVQVPIQVIDSTFGNSAKKCAGANTSPSEGGYTAILGVGLFRQDCGDGCASLTGGGMYFACDSSDPTSACMTKSVSRANQVSNPIAQLPTDNNGVVLQLPAVPEGGADFANGYLILGIGTQTNNIPDSTTVTTFATDPYWGEFKTTLNGHDYTQSFIDSGSNVLFFQPFPATLLPDCGADLAGWFCPTATQSFTATNTAVSTGTSGSTDFTIGNTQSLTENSYLNNVFAELGNNPSDGGDSFDWGLPFFFGKTVYVGLENAPSNLASGPYWAY